MRDASGKELAVINQAEEIDWNVYGLQRVAQFRHTLPVDDGVELDIIVLLEGPADTLGQMSTVLNGMRQILPGMTQANQPPQTPAGQPYNTAPWNYDGLEGADFTNADYAPTVVDWVLLSLRTDLTKDSEVYKTAALLHQDGHIELLTPTRLPLDLPPVYIAIEHRNHMGAISLQPIHVVNGQLTYDFTSENSYTGVGAGQKLHPKTGKWMLHAGNSANDLGYDINGVDQAKWSQHNGFFGQYLPTDYNLDGDVNGEDKVLWQQNNGVYSQMEFSVGSAPRVAPTDFIYYIYDHLGNTRVAYSVDIIGTDPLYPPTINYTVTSAVDYFPYGAELRSYGKSRYLTTQHERDLETGFDYRGARFYDSEVGRFLSVDPLASEYPSYSDYAYVAGNPIIFIDPDGRNTIYYDEDGNELHRSEDDLDDAVVVIKNDDLDGFKKAMGLEIESNNDYNEVLRSYGLNYMVEGMKDLITKGLSEIYEENKKFYNADKTFAKLHPEYSSSILLVGNELIVDKNDYVSGTATNVGLGGRFTIHSHTNGYISKESNKLFIWQQGLADLTPVNLGGSPGAPPSTDDYDNYETSSLRDTKFFDVAISPTKIWFYRLRNDDSEQTFSAPLNFFK